MATLSRFLSAAKQGVTSVQTAYQKEVAAAEKRAATRRQNAMTKAERQRINAELELEKLRLQRDAYAAKAAVIREKEVVRRARHEAGEYTLGEKASQAAGSAASGLRNVLGRIAEAQREPVRRKRKTTATRTVRPTAKKRVSRR